ncbi:MAG TPA: hypothetical protein VHW00_25365 [Thermoanaerobaculia bacterium]|nr:hypothetical protein [Thermoanaerobaculia bacterium]
MTSAEPRIAVHVESALDAVPASPVIEPLRRAFRAHDAALRDIESSFREFTASMPTPERARHFFHSWSLTNHSAMCVSGIGNRMTLRLRDSRNGIDKSRLTAALLSLHRISDEDLGALGGTLHADLFYEMAELFCGGDAWLSRAYAVESARAFKEYKNRAGLRTPDLMFGLLSTVAHEVYTHGEVEFILPLFKECVKHFAIDEKQQRRRLGWISIHCGPTEREHFRHAVEAIEHYCAALHLDPLAYDLDALFGEYIENKAAVMRDLSRLMTTVH